MEIEEYMKLPYKTTVEADQCAEGICFMAYNPELEGCMAQGTTPDEAVANLKSARRLYISALLKRGLAVPMPQTYSTEPIIARAVPEGSPIPQQADTRHMRGPAVLEDRFVVQDEVAA